MLDPKMIGHGTKLYEESKVAMDSFLQALVQVQQSLRRGNATTDPIPTLLSHATLQLLKLKEQQRSLGLWYGMNLAEAVRSAREQASTQSLALQNVAYQISHLDTCMEQARRETTTTVTTTTTTTSTTLPTSATATTATAVATTEVHSVTDTEMESPSQKKKANKISPAAAVSITSCTGQLALMAQQELYGSLPDTHDNSNNNNNNNDNDNNNNKNQIHHMINVFLSNAGTPQEDVLEQESRISIDTQDVLMSHDSQSLPSTFDYTDPKHHHDNIRKLQMEIQIRQKLQEELQQAMVLKEQSLQRLQSMNNFLQGFQTQVYKIEDSTLYLQDYFIKQYPSIASSSSSSTTTTMDTTTVSTSSTVFSTSTSTTMNPTIYMTSSTRRNRLLAAQELPTPLYTLFCQLQSFVDFTTINNHCKNTQDSTFTFQFMEWDIEIVDSVTPNGSFLSKYHALLEREMNPNSNISTNKNKNEWTHDWLHKHDKAIQLCILDSTELDTSWIYSKNTTSHIPNHNTSTHINTNMTPRIPNPTSYTRGQNTPTCIKIQFEYFTQLQLVTAHVVGESISLPILQTTTLSTMEETDISSYSKKKKMKIDSPNDKSYLSWLQSNLLWNSSTQQKNNDETITYHDREAIHDSSSSSSSSSSSTPFSSSSYYSSLQLLLLHDLFWNDHGRELPNASLHDAFLVNFDNKKKNDKNRNENEHDTKMNDDILTDDIVMTSYSSNTDSNTEYTNATSLSNPVSEHRHFIQQSFSKVRQLFRDEIPGIKPSDIGYGRPYYWCQCLSGLIYPAPEEMVMMEDDNNRNDMKTWTDVYIPDDKNDREDNGQVGQGEPVSKDSNFLDPCEYVESKSIQKKKKSPKLYPETQTFITTLTNRIYSHRALGQIFRFLHNAKKPLLHIPIPPSLTNSRVMTTNHQKSADDMNSTKLIKWSQVYLMEDFVSKGIFDKIERDSNAYRYYCATLQRGSSTLEAYVKINVTSYPETAPQWSLCNQDDTKVNHSKDDPSGCRALKHIGTFSTPPLYDASLSHIENKVNRSLDIEPRLEAKDSTHNWLLLYQLHDIIFMLDDMMSCSENNVDMCDNGIIPNGTSRVRRGRDRLPVCFS